MFSLLLGVRRAGITVALQGLEKRGLIERSRGNITVLDRARLSASANGLYGQPRVEFKGCLEVGRPTTTSGRSRLAPSMSGYRRTAPRRNRMTAAPHMVRFRTVPAWNASATLYNIAAPWAGAPSSALEPRLQPGSAKSLPGFFGSARTSDSEADAGLSRRIVVSQSTWPQSYGSRTVPCHGCRHWKELGGRPSAWPN